MVITGLDQHKHFSRVAVTDEAGAVIEEQRLGHADKDIIARYFEPFKGNAKIAMESTGNWTWMCDLLEGQGLDVHLAHPLKTRIICESKVKTDKIDARMLAHLLRANLLAESYIAPLDVRSQRQQLRYRQSLIRVRTGLKNRVHGVLEQLGIAVPPVSDLFGKEGLSWLNSLAIAEPYAASMQGYLRLIREIDLLITAVDKEIKQSLKTNPAASLLDTIPGIGTFTAQLLLAEIGDIRRFASTKKLCSYAGLVPSTHQSGETLYHGSITKQGNRYIRWAMTEAAQKAYCKDHYLARFYATIYRKKGKAKAITAVARKLLVSVYHVLIKNEPYRIPGKPVERAGQLSL